MCPPMAHPGNASTEKVVAGSDHGLLGEDRGGLGHRAERAGSVLGEQGVDLSSSSACQDPMPSSQPRTLTLLGRAIKELA